jgi:hemerythrin
MPEQFRNLDWKGEYSVGVPLLDNQHKEIFRSIQKITDFKAKSDSSNVFSDSIEDITRLMSDHLKDEEDYLLQHNYPLLNEHKQEHLNLMDGYTELLYRFTKGEKGVDKKLVEFLHHWWVTHIFEVDMKYKEYFKALDSNRD